MFGAILLSLDFNILHFFGDCKSYNICKKMLQSFLQRPFQEYLHNFNFSWIHTKVLNMLWKFCKYVCIFEFAGCGLRAFNKV